MQRVRAREPKSGLKFAAISKSKPKSSNERTLNLLKSDHFLRRPFLTNVSTRSECVDACCFFNMYQNSLALRRFAAK